MSDTLMPQLRELVPAGRILTEQGVVAIPLSRPASRSIPRADVASPPRTMSLQVLAESVGTLRLSGRVLERLGRAGLYAPLIAVGIGVLVPQISELGRTTLLPAIALMLAMSIALVDAGRLRAIEAVPAIGLACSNLILVPVLTHAVVTALGFGDAAVWLVLVAGGPAAGGAALAAGLLGLPMRPVVLSQMVCFAALPLTAPLVTTLLMNAGAIDPAGLFLRVGLLVLLPSLAGLGLRRMLGERRRHAQADTLRGLGVLGLCGIGFAIATGLPGAFASAGQLVVVLIGLVLVSAMSALLGCVAGLGLGGATMLALALGGAIRNASLLWGATAGIIPVEGEHVMQLATLWTLTVPALLAGLRRLRAVRH